MLKSRWKRLVVKSGQSKIARLARADKKHTATQMATFYSHVKQEKNILEHSTHQRRQAKIAKNHSCQPIQKSVITVGTDSPIFFLFFNLQMSSFNGQCTAIIYYN